MTDVNATVKEVVEVSCLHRRLVVASLPTGSGILATSTPVESLFEHHDCKLS
jgi:hypothetical protein